MALGPLMGPSIFLPFLGATTGKAPFILAAVLVALRAIAGAEEKSALLILVSIFLWFFGYQGVLPCLSTYMLDMVGVPAGDLASRLGRKRVARASLFALLIVFVAVFLHDLMTKGLGLSASARLFSFLFLMFCLGAF